MGSVGFPPPFLTSGSFLITWRNHQRLKSNEQLRTSQMAESKGIQKGNETPEGLQYSRRFFNDEDKDSLLAARIIVPLIVDQYHPSSVLDVGCGVGNWLHQFMLQGVQDVMGVDFYVDRQSLAFPVSRYRTVDLRRRFTLGRQFDVTICLEVAEHIPKESSMLLIDSITGTSDIIVFSAAIPSQGGTHHINEQWAEYWSDLFSTKGFLPLDSLRGPIWTDKRLPFWYRQNILVYARPAVIKQRKICGILEDGSRLSVVHPSNFIHWSRMFLEDNKRKGPIVLLRWLRMLNRTLSYSLSVRSGRPLLTNHVFKRLQTNLCV